MYRSDRASQRNGGGVAIYVRSYLKVEKLDFSEYLYNCESLWLSLKIDNQILIVATAYVAPNVCKIVFLSKIAEILEQPSLNRANIILTGDFNIN